MRRAHWTRSCTPTARQLASPYVGVAIGLRETLATPDCDHPWAFTYYGPRPRFCSSKALYDGSKPASLSSCPALALYPLYFTRTMSGPIARSSSAESLLTIGSDEAQQYYRERHGRRFHSKGALYCLPNDEEELGVRSQALNIVGLTLTLLEQRLDLQHDLLKILIGGPNYFGPLQEVLRRGNGAAHKRVLDLGRSRAPLIA